jgi:site-specific DNA-methyltransferase (cytosine-N4-specific)
MIARVFFFVINNHLHDLGVDKRSFQVLCKFSIIRIMTAIPSFSTLRNINWDFAGVKTNHLTHGIHPYPAKYIPQIPSALIRELSKPKDRIADIFCGSGTTLVEALILGRNAVGIDANPLACLISEAKTAHLTDVDKRVLDELVTNAKLLSSKISLQISGLFAQDEGFITKAPRPDSEVLEFWFEPFVVEEIAEALAWCNELPTDMAKKVAKVALSAIIVTVSKQDSDTRYVRREKNILPGDTLNRFARSLSNTVEAISEFNQTHDKNLQCEVYNTNILSKPSIGEFDLMVCSPPYPNAFSYHLYHMTRMVWLGMDQPKFKKEEIGSHRKYSSKSQNGATAKTFKEEMGTIFEWLYCSLKLNRYACFVVGNSTIRGETVDNAQLISDEASARGFIEIDRLDRKMQETKKAFNPAHGRIKTEQILILKKI